MSGSVGGSVIGNIDSSLFSKIFLIKPKENMEFELENYPELNELGEWLEKKGNIWRCRSDISQQIFTHRFYAITKLNEQEVTISISSKNRGLFT